MYEKYKNSYKVTEKELVSLSVYNVGFQRCDSLYQWGPGIRDHNLIHYIISGKGFSKIGKRTYELQAGDSFLVYPNTEVVYYAAETDPWEYAWVGFTGSDASMILKATDFSPEKPIIRETPHGSDIHRQILHIYDARGNEFEHAVEMTGRLIRCLPCFYTAPPIRRSKIPPTVMCRKASSISLPIILMQLLWRISQTMSASAAATCSVLLNRCLVSRQRNI